MRKTEWISNIYCMKAYAMQFRGTSQLDSQLNSECALPGTQARMLGRIDVNLIAYDKWFYGFPRKKDEATQLAEDDEDGEKDEATKLAEDDEDGNLILLKQLVKNNELPIGGGGG
jgi:hypothetical protein